MLASVRILLAGALALAACSRGPDAAVLPEDLQRRIDGEFEDGLFSIRSFDRTGSAPFRDAERGVTGVYVYYDAELEFLRGYNLTSWKGLNLGTLAFTLGATEAGIEGFRSDGNAQGDVLRVYGRMSYARADGEWKPLDDVGGQPQEEVTPAPTTLEGSGAAAVLRSVRELVERVAPPGRPTRDTIVVDELRRAVGRIDLEFARLDGRLTLGTGQLPGVYREFGAAFAEYASARALPLHDHQSDGSVRNGFDVHSLLLDFALMQSDVAEILFAGWFEEDQIARPNLRSLASLWPEAVQIVTLEGTGIERIADLRGKRLATGSPGSGSRFNAIRVATAAGLTRPDFAEVRQVGLAQGIADLERGEVDVLFVTQAVPTPALQALFRRRQDVRFVRIDPAVVSQLSEKYFSYYPLVVPAKTYPGQLEPLRTLGMTAVLVTNRLTPDDQVERVLGLLVEGAEELSKIVFRAGFISRETMRLGIAVPLHPAATRFYARLEKEPEAEAQPLEAEAPPEADAPPPEASPPGDR